MKTQRQLIVGWMLFSLSALLLLGFIGAAWWRYRPSPSSNQTIVLPQTSKDQNRPGRKGRSREEKLSAYVASNQPQPIAHVFVPLAGVVQPESSRYLGNPRGRRPPGDFLPPPPLRIARASEKIDPKLLDWLARWDAGLQSGQSPSADQFQELEQLLAATQLSWSSLYGIGQGMAYFGGDGLSLPWHRATVRQAEAELKTLSPDAPAIEEIHQALLRLARPFYRSKQYVDAAEVFGMIRELEEPGSKEAWKAGYWEAESWYLLGRSDPAANEKVIELVMANLTAEEMTEIQRGELHFLIAGSLYQLGRYVEAAPHFEQAIKMRSEATLYAREYLIRSLALSGRVEQAKSCYEHWLAQTGPDTESAQSLARIIESSEERFTRTK